MCIKDDGTSMQWQIQLGSVEVAPTELVHLPTNDRPVLHEFINANINQFASHTNLHVDHPMPMEKGYCPV